MAEAYQIRNLKRLISVRLSKKVLERNISNTDVTHFDEFFKILYLFIVILSPILDP